MPKTIKETLTSITKECESIKLDESQQIISQIISAAQNDPDACPFQKPLRKTFPDGTTICCTCGFCLPFKMDKCPCCGQELHDPENKSIFKHKTVTLVSILSKLKQKRHVFLVQRQFIIIVGPNDYCKPDVIDNQIYEIYRNFITEKGDVIPFRRNLIMYNSFALNPYNLSSPIKHHPNNNYYTPLSWDILIGEELLPTLRKRLKRKKK